MFENEDEIPNHFNGLGRQGYWRFEYPIKNVDYGEIMIISYGYYENNVKVGLWIRKHKYSNEIIEMHYFVN